MSDILDAFETDDPDQMSDILLDTIGQLIEADRAGDGPIIEELWEKVEDMISSLVEAVQTIPRNELVAPTLESRSALSAFVGSNSALMERIFSGFVEIVISPSSAVLMISMVS